MLAVLVAAGTWAYFCTILSTFVYTCVPMVSLVWGVHPVALNGPFALAATLYFLAGGLLGRACVRAGGWVGGRVAQWAGGQARGCTHVGCLVWGVHPVALNGPFALAATLYFLAAELAY